LGKFRLVLEVLPGFGSLPISDFALAAKLVLPGFGSFAKSLVLILPETLTCWLSFFIKLIK
jgi:hypothetical protein